ncbi:hypothetical protein [Streptomyces sp. NPDC002187]|uniref:hypothetical protein n=1 Tax=Streptomyces sp. NPDC002187 TaxID=3364637 RepID=UPI0036849F7D
MLKMAATRAVWRRWVPAVTVAVAVGSAGVVTATPAAAQTLVNCTSQNLQTAIDNAAPGATLVIRGTCYGNFRVGKSLSLVGVGGAVLDGNHEGTVLTVRGSRNVQVDVSRLGIAHGFDVDGGGLLNVGATVTLSGSTVRDNTATRFGGGIASSGKLKLTNSTVQANTARAGGGIANAGSLELNWSKLRGNTVLRAGGGLLNLAGGTARLSASTVMLNSARDGMSGGIHNVGGPVVVVHSAVTGNSPNNCSSVIPGCRG